MLKLIQTLGFILFFLCLFLMYATNIGIRGIRKYDSSFRSPDMKFHYNAETISQAFDRLGENGKNLYRNYIILDFAFIACFLVVMITITNLLFLPGSIRTVLFTICVLRSLFDIIENSLLLLTLKNHPIIDKPFISICSCFTSLKFIMLYLWILALIVYGVVTYFKLW